MLDEPDDQLRGARITVVIQQLSLREYRRRRDAARSGKEVADYEASVKAVIHALQMAESSPVNEKSVWTDAAVRLAKRRGKSLGDVKEGAIRNAVECRVFLQYDVHECLVETLQAEIDTAFARAGDHAAALATRLSTASCSNVVKVGADDHSARLNSHELYLMAVDDMFLATHHATGVRLKLKLDSRLPETNLQQLLLVTQDVKTFALTLIKYISMKSGSTNLIIELTPNDAETMTRLFKEGSLTTLGGIRILAVDEGGESNAGEEFADEWFPIMLDLKEPITDADQRALAKFISEERKRAEQVESRVDLALFSILTWLRKLRWRSRISIWARIGLIVIFFAASIVRAGLDLLSVISPRRLGTDESAAQLIWSASRWFAASWKQINRVRLIKETANAFMIWPLVTGIFITTVLAAFTQAGIPVLLWSSASGAALSIAGGLVCSSVLSIRACGAAGVPLGTAFGVVHGLIILGNGGILKVAEIAAGNNAFTRVVGGLVAVDAPRSLGSSFLWATVALGLPAIGIASAAKLMATPNQVAKEPHPRFWKEVLGAILGCSVGVSIFLLMKLTEFLTRFVPGRTAFLIAYSVISLVALFSLFRLRRCSMGRSAAFTMLFLVAGALLVIAALWLPVGWSSLLANSAATGMFHAVFFTLAWLIGYRFWGWRAGVAAAILEGVGGYVGFALSRAF
jgi:hypothetical protein